MTVKARLEGFRESEYAALSHLLYPFDVEIVTTEKSDVIVSGDPLLESKPMIHAESTDQRALLYLDNEHDRIHPPLNAISDCAQKFECVMNPKPAFMYKMATRFPITYNIVPPWIRSLLLRTGHVDSNLSNHLSNEIARRGLREAFASSGFRLRTREAPRFLITHDVDTAKGLEKALSMKKVEEELDLQSTWFLSSGDYSISKKMAKDLGSGSTIGSHDVKHDGRLVHIRNHKELVRRLGESRMRLEQVFERDVKCFRSPLLQFSESIIQGLSEAGYQNDFSLPCWEPSYPITLRGFGVECTKPMKMHGVLETPLSLFQDHQLLYVLGLTPCEAVEFWIEQARIIQSYDGNIVLLVHPDYAFSNELGAYRELLVALRTMADSQLFQS